MLDNIFKQRLGTDISRAVSVISCATSSQNGSYTLPCVETKVYLTAAQSPCYASLIYAFEGCTSTDNLLYASCVPGRDRLPQQIRLHKKNSESLFVRLHHASSPNSTKESVPYLPAMVRDCDKLLQLQVVATDGNGSCPRSVLLGVATCSTPTPLAPAPEEVERRIRPPFL